MTFLFIKAHIYAHTAAMITLTNAKLKGLTFEAKFSCPFSEGAPIQSTDRFLQCFSSISNTYCMKEVSALVNVTC